MNGVRAKLFNALVWINLPLALLASMILYGQLGREVSWMPRGFDRVEGFFGLNFETPARPIVLVALVLILYFTAYLLSFNFYAEKRPVKRLMLIHEEIAVILIFTCIAWMDLAFNFLSIILVLAIFLLYPLAAWGIERGVGRFCGVVGPGSGRPRKSGDGGTLSLSFYFAQSNAD